MITLTVAKSEARRNICSVWQRCIEVYLVMGICNSEIYCFVFKGNILDKTK